MFFLFFRNWLNYWNFLFHNFLFFCGCKCLWFGGSVNLEIYSFNHDVNFFLVTLLTYSLKFDLGRFFLLLLSNHSAGNINRAARFLWLALANHKNRLERAIFLIVKHIKLVFVFLHVLFYHSLKIRLFIAPLIFQKWGLQLKVLEPLLLNVSGSLEVLLGLRDVHASLLWKFVAAE